MAADEQILENINNELIQNENQQPVNINEDVLNPENPLEREKLIEERTNPQNAFFNHFLLRRNRIKLEQYNPINPETWLTNCIRIFGFEQVYDLPERIW